MKEQSKINELIQVCHKAAQDNGFWDTERNQDKAFSLILLEIFEAFEGHRKGKFADMKEFLEHTENDRYDFENSPKSTKVSFERFIKDSFEDEIADTFIRLFDYCGGFSIDLSYSDFEMEKVISENFGQTLLAIINALLVEKKPIMAVNNLYYFLLLIVEKYDIEIERHIELKLKYNALRGYKHGKLY